MLDYRNLRGVRERLIVGDAQVDRQMDALLDANMKVLPIADRPSQADDELVLDYAGEIGGEYFAGGTAENQTLVLGSGAFIPGFEEQLIGRRAGDSVDVRVTFPEDYHARELAGREAVFHCRIKEIRLRRRYAPDDEFAREVGGCESYAAFRESVRAALQAYADAQSEAELRAALLDQVCAGAEFEIEPAALERALELELKSFERQLASQGLNLDLYAQFMHTSREKLRDDLQPHACRNVERQMAVREIARIEGIEADEAGVAEKLGEICRENKLTIAELQPRMDEAFQAAVEESVVTDRVLDFLVQSARIENVEKRA